jgi:hypothetical protein
MMQAHDFDWETLLSDIHYFISTCPTCQETTLLAPPPFPISYPKALE